MNRSKVENTALVKFDYMLEHLVYPRLLWCNMTIEIWVIIYQVKTFFGADNQQERLKIA